MKNISEGISYVRNTHHKGNYTFLIVTVLLKEHRGFQHPVLSHARNDTVRPFSLRLLPVRVGRRTRDLRQWLRSLAVSETQYSNARILPLLQLLALRSPARGIAKRALCSV
jgi:hypothetical protein